MAVEIRDEIVAHLITCKKCLKVYQDYAREIGLSFNLNREIMRVYSEYSDKIPSRKLSNMEISKKIKDKKFLDNLAELKKHYYTKKAVDRDLEGVLGVQSVRELANEKLFISDNGEIEDSFVEYTWYLVEKLCKKVDALNNIFRLSGGKDK